MKKIKISILISVFFLFSLFSSTAFAVPDDSILSKHIKEADGTSGQNTNSGSGIKTGHIQDGAVTTGKIVDGAVTTTKIIDGAVTDSKITGPISATKISTTGLNADTVDGKHASDFAASNHNHDNIYEKRYRNVVIVSADGNGDFTNLVDALNSITGSATNPYLVKIMPGVYILNDHTRIFPKNYVDIEGSGKGITKITGHDINFYFSNTNNTELRDLTIESYGPVCYDTPFGRSCGGYSAIVMGWNSSPRLTNVDINGIDVNDGVYMHGNPVLKNVNINVPNTKVGVRIGCCDEGDTSTAKIYDSIIKAGYSIQSIYSSNQIFVAGSQLDGILGGNGTIKLVNCYDGNFNPIPNQ